MAAGMAAAEAMPVVAPYLDHEGKIDFGRAAKDAFGVFYPKKEL